MRVSAELSGRRLAVALLLIGLLPAALAFGAVHYQRPDVTPGPPAYNPLPLPKTPVLTAIQARELQRSRRMTREAPSLSRLALLGPTFPDLLPTIVLAPRQAPYRLSELQRRLPSAFGSVGNALLLRASIEVPTGTHLVIDADTPNVHLASSPRGFATIIARGGKVDISGTADRPVHLSSWDEGRRKHDTDRSDGRSFLLAFGGRMDITRADIGYLGFGTGTSSGVAWRGGPQSEGVEGPPAYGSVTSSRLHHNRFGAYTFDARDMRWTHNTFADNDAYGFDPHDLSNDFLVEHNVAHGNGRHGFIFSRGCDRNIMRNNLSYENRGHGFMIDDGRSEDGESVQARQLASNDNQVVGNRAYDNDGSGVEIEGGTGNVVKDNVLERNHVGVRVKDGASATVVGNRIADSRLFGVDVLKGAGKVAVSANHISGGWASISLGKAHGASLNRNTLEDASTPLVIAGKSVRDETVATTVSRFFKWNPLLILWTAILGAPITIGVMRLVSFTVRRRQARASMS